MAAHRHGLPARFSQPLLHYGPCYISFVSTPNRRLVLLSRTELVVVVIVLPEERVGLSIVPHSMQHCSSAQS